MINIDFKPYSIKELYIKQNFFRFLKDSELYPLYVYNINNVGFDYVQFSARLSNGRSLIAIAFQWEKTKEGYDFWRKRHHLWLQYLTLCNLKGNN